MLRVSSCWPGAVHLVIRSKYFKHNKMTNATIQQVYLWVYAQFWFYIICEILLLWLCITPFLLMHIVLIMGFESESVEIVFNISYSDVNYNCPDLNPPFSKCSLLNLIFPAQGWLSWTSIWFVTPAVLQVYSLQYRGLLSSSVLTPLTGWYNFSTSFPRNKQEKSMFLVSPLSVVH